MQGQIAWSLETHGNLAPRGDTQHKLLDYSPLTSDMDSTYKFPGRTIYSEVKCFFFVVVVVFF